MPTEAATLGIRNLPCQARSGERTRAAIRASLVQNALRLSFALPFHRMNRFSIRGPRGYRSRFTARKFRASPAPKSRLSTLLRRGLTTNLAQLRAPSHREPLFRRSARRMLNPSVCLLSTADTAPGVCACEPCRDRQHPSPASPAPTSSSIARSSASRHRKCSRLSPAHNTLRSSCDGQPEAYTGLRQRCIVRALWLTGPTDWPVMALTDA